MGWKSFTKENQNGPRLNGSHNENKIVKSANRLNDRFIKQAAFEFVQSNAKKTAQLFSWTAS